jgi:hypothetical protein
VQPGAYALRVFGGVQLRYRGGRCVQQPCSNPSESPEILGKVLTQKYALLQAFCKHLKASAKYCAAFARRRSGVRIPSAPLFKYRHLQGKLQPRIYTPIASRALVQQRGGEPANVTVSVFCDLRMTLHALTLSWSFPLCYSRSTRLRILSGVLAAYAPCLRPPICGGLRRRRTAR